MLSRTSGGTTPSTATRASSTLSTKSTVVTMTTVRPWTASWTKPSRKSSLSCSMSLVIRVMITPAFSRV